MSIVLDPENVPAAPAPPGVQSDLVNPPDLYHASIAVAVCAFALTAPPVIIRLFTTWYIQKQFNWDDLVLIIATISFIAFQTMIIHSPTAGADLWNTSVANAARFGYWSSVLLSLFNPIVLFSKWAVALQTHRMLTIHRYDLSWWMTTSILCVSGMFNVAMMLVSIFACVPRQKIWVPETPGTCVDSGAAQTASAIVNIFINAAILAVPILVVWRSHMQNTRKVLVSAIFGITILATIASIARTVYVHDTLVRRNDLTRDIFVLGYFASTEITFLILAAAFPAVPCFYKWCRSRARDHEAEAACAVESQLRHLRSRRKAWLQLMNQHDSIDPRKHGWENNVSTRREVIERSSKIETAAHASRELRILESENQ